MACYIATEACSQRQIELFFVRHIRNLYEALIYQSRAVGVAHNLFVCSYRTIICQGIYALTNSSPATFHLQAYNLNAQILRHGF